MIKTEEIKKFILERSSFGFELEVVKKIRSLGFEVSHSGAYTDPSTGLNRQFDIRAQMKLSNTWIFLCIECKKISSSFPVVVACSERRSDENYHTILRSSDNPIPGNIRIADSQLYPLGLPVGRSIEQWSNNIKSKSPDDLWSKFNQATQHSVSITSLVCQLLKQERGRRAIIIPCVVIPDEMLWVCKFKEDGDIIEDPKQINHVSQSLALASNHQPIIGGHLYQYSFSHIELMTVSGITDFWDNRIQRKSDWTHIFP